VRAKARIVSSRSTTSSTGSIRNRAKCGSREEDAVCVSALTGEGADDLLQHIDKRLAASRQTVEYDLPYGDGASLAWLHEHGQVFEERQEDDHLHVVVALDPADRQRFEHRMKAAI